MPHRALRPAAYAAEQGATGYERYFDIDSNTPETKIVQKSSSSLKGMKVLLAEDNGINMEIAKTILEDEGIDVITADNGQFAVNIFNYSPFFLDMVTRFYYLAKILHISVPLRSCKIVSSLKSLDKPRFIFNNNFKIETI